MAGKCDLILALYISVVVPLQDLSCPSLLSSPLSLHPLTRLPARSEMFMCYVKEALSVGLADYNLLTEGLVIYTKRQEIPGL